jgi:hypothetical protein
MNKRIVALIIVVAVVVIYLYRRSRSATSASTSSASTSSASTSSSAPPVPTVAPWLAPPPAPAGGGYGYTSTPNMNYISSQIQTPGQDNAGEGIHFIGTAASEAACQSAISASGIPNLAFYVYTPAAAASTPAWANTCYARDDTIGDYGTVQMGVLGGVIS